jgi:GNAT superfamily N-acetyltransferase
MKQQIVDLWRASFGDPEDFIRLWFGRVYREEDTLAATEGGRVVAALQTVPYAMTCHGERVAAAYVCGVCTLPSERGKGRMTALMRQAMGVMRDRGFALAMLVPASEWLFDYYRRFGFAVAFRYSVETHLSGRAAPPAACRIAPSGCITAEGVFPFYDRVQCARDCAVLHDAYGLETVRLDCVAEGGDCWTALVDGQMAGIAFAVPQADGRVFIKEIACDGDVLRRAMIQAVMRHYGARAATVRIPPVAAASVPYGMACVLDTERMRDLRATAYMNLMLD